jgi:SnoaL-like domain
MSDGSDADQIRDLLFAYCWHMDRGEFDELGALFAHASLGDGTTPGAPGLEGAAAIAAMYRGRCILYDDGTPRTKHVCTNPIVEFDPDGDRATCRSYYLVEQQLDDFPLQPIVGGRYHDTFVRVDGRWRFAERRFYVDLVGDVSRHQREALRDQA